MTASVLRLKDAEVACFFPIDTNMGSATSRLLSMKINAALVHDLLVEYAAVMFHMFSVVVASPQVGQPVIQRVAVDVINKQRTRVLAMPKQPSQPMGQIT